MDIFYYFQRKPRILITGGAGYIGTRLSNYLTTKNYQVTVVDNFWFGDYLDPSIKKLKKVYGIFLHLI